MNKQWIYRNDQRPFSVTDIELPSGIVFFTSVSINGFVFDHNSHGERRGFSDINDYDLIPYEPYSDYLIDDEVHCWNDAGNGIVTSGHFAGLNSEGRPTTFTMGGTSFTRHSLEVVAWFFCEKADKEDK
jgi:hypothetical protein